MTFCHSEILQLRQNLSFASFLAAFELSQPSNSLVIVIAVIFVVVAAAIVTALVFLIRCYHKSYKSYKDTDVEARKSLVQPPEPTSKQLDLAHLKPECTIHRGRYGEVCKAVLNDTEVAVKSLHPSHRQYYYNERDIYLQVRMKHENIAKFCGYYDKPANDVSPAQYMIVTAYMEHGTLTNYLKNNTVDWQTMCRMWHSMTSGLAHLHTEIIIGGLLLLFVFITF